jgi:hypothetical protein
MPIVSQLFIICQPALSFVDQMPSHYLYLSQLFAPVCWIVTPAGEPEYRLTG